MNLTAYVMDGHRIDIRPAPVERAWMEKTPQRYAYRCLPLNIANAHGWEILCPSTFTAVWNGTNALNALRIQASPDTIAPALSLFGLASEATFRRVCYAMIAAAAFVSLPIFDGLLR